MNRTRIRDRGARAAVRIARRAGVRMDYITPAGSSTTLYGFIESSRQTAGLRGGETDDFEFVVVIPRQTGFPPASFTPGGLIRYPITTGTQYQIDEIEPDNEEITQASTFRLRCGRYGESADY